MRIPRLPHVGRNDTRGLTILEIIVTMAIASVAMVLIANLQKELVTISRTMRSSFSAQQDARRAFKAMTSELRVAQYAENGAYPVEAATAQSVTFYADADANGSEERIRYFTSGTDLKRGVIIPTGSPAVYNTANETFITLAGNITNGSTAMFDYYNAAYDGTTAAMSLPVSSSTVRLVKITLIIDPESGRPPGPQTYTTQVSLRNLKDSL